MKFTIRILSKEKVGLETAWGGDRLCCVALENEKKERKSAPKPREERGELAVDSEKLTTLHVVGGGDLLGKLRSLGQQ